LPCVGITVVSHDPSTAVFHKFNDAAKYAMEQNAEGNDYAVFPSGVI
jgi:hypothetical protein